MKNLKEMRKEAGYTQATMAALLHISQQTYSDYENGKTFPDETVLIKIADTLDVSTDFLLGRTDDLGVPLSPGNAPLLTMEDRELLELFHRLGEQRKEDVFLYMRALAGADPYTASLKRKK